MNAYVVRVKIYRLTYAIPKEEQIYSKCINIYTSARANMNVILYGRIFIYFFKPKQNNRMFCCFFFPIAVMNCIPRKLNANIADSCGFAEISA